MTDIGKIEFNANPESSTRSVPLKGWPQPKTKEELEEEELGYRTIVGNFGPVTSGLLPKKSNSAGIETETPIMDKQVGGSHYKQYKIQPYEFFIVNQIPHHKAAIIRRILRYDHPTGKGLEDLQKIRHEIEMIIQLENWEEESKIDTQTKEKACKCK